MKHFEKIRLFWKKTWYFWVFLCGILPLTLVFALSFATWTFRGKNGTFWENTGYFWDTSGYFWETYGSNQALGGPFLKNPTGLVPLFVRLSKCENFWYVSVSILGVVLLTLPTSVTDQQNINIQTKYKVIVSQMPVVMSQVAQRKCWTRGFARGTWSSGKRFLQESLPIPNFLTCFKKMQETSSFRLLGNAKNATDLKPYWSRAGLRHPELNPPNNKN